MQTQNELIIKENEKKNRNIYKKTIINKCQIIKNVRNGIIKKHKIFSKWKNVRNGNRKKKGIIF